MLVAPECNELMVRVFSEVCEQMLFMFADECGTAPLDEPPYLQASVTFAGPCAGKLWLVAPAVWCEEMAASALGLEPGEAEDAVSGADALSELLNVVCGQFVGQLGGPRHAFSLSIPEAVVPAVVAVEALRMNTDHVVCTVEGHVVLMCWQVELQPVFNGSP